MRALLSRSEPRPSAGAARPEPAAFAARASWPLLYVAYGELVLVWLFRGSVHLDAYLLLPLGVAFGAAALAVATERARPGLRVVLAAVYGALAWAQWVRTVGHPTRWAHPKKAALAIVLTGAAGVGLGLWALRRLPPERRARLLPAAPALVTSFGLALAWELSHRTLGFSWDGAPLHSLFVTAADLLSVVALLGLPAALAVLGRRSKRRKATALAALAALAAGTLVASRDGRRASADVEPRNVVLVVVDSLRADRIGTPATPVLNDLASRGARFTDHRSGADGTMAAFPALLTGDESARAPAPEMLLRRRFSRRPPSSVVADMQARGHAVFFASAFLDLLDASPVISRVLVDVDAVSVPSLEVTGAGHLVCAVLTGLGARDAHCAPRPTLVNLDDFLSRAVSDEPFFLVVHLHGPHDSYPRGAPTFFQGDAAPVLRAVWEAREGRPLSAREVEQLNALYDDSTLAADAEVGALLQKLASSNRLATTSVFVTADHGEMLGEHGEVLHARAPYEPALRVPLLAMGPGIPAGLEVDRPTHHADVRALLVGSADGRSLGDALEGLRRRRVRTFRSGGGAWGGLDGRLKVVQGPRQEGAVFFDLEADPGELAPRTVRPGSEEEAILREAAGLLGRRP